MRCFENIYYTDDRHPMQMLDIYLPDAESFSTFIYFHGGGLEAGSRKGEAPSLSRTLCAHGVALVSVEYRLYPQAAYPDFIEDAAAAVAWVKAHIGEYGQCDRLYVGGSSAGGYLSMMLCFDGRYLGRHGIRPTDLAGFVHDAGQPTVHYNVLRQRGIDTRRVIVDESAPLYHVGLAEVYPPMLFIVSDNDMENRLQQTDLMRSTLRHFGYDQDRIAYRLMHGNHCAYVNCEEDGENILGREVLAFMGA